ncbi:MAG: UbiA prenyltransferase family protein [bacterium]|nr:UbiA prenyltransferase family protein [bacterium]
MGLFARWMGYGTTSTKDRYTTAERAIGFVDITRPILAMMGPLIAGAGAVLSIKGFPPLDKCILGSLAVLIATFGIHAFNDWADRKRDKLVWPNRPIPAKRVKESEALLYSIILFVIALFISWIVFNTTTFIILLIALILGCIYSIYLRDRIGYLTLPPIIGLFPIGGWAAFSPQTLFSNPLPWVLYLLGLLWQAGHIMVYSPVHPVQKVKEKLRTEVPALFFVPSPKSASILGVVFLFLTWIVSIALYFATNLTYVYLIIAVLSGLMAVSAGIRLIQDPINKKRALLAFNVASLYEMLLFGGILLDSFLYKVVLKGG